MELFLRNPIHRAPTRKYFNKDKNPTSGVPFEDPNFPPNVNSIEARDSNGNFIDPINGPLRVAGTSSDKIEWKRASEIFKGKSYAVFKEEIEPNDIIQRQLGDCYFLSALASLAEFPYLVYKLFLAKTINKSAYFAVQFYIDGEPRIVVVDDYLPVKKGTNNLIYSVTSTNELWVPILEKAWAKVNGGYANIIAGDSSDVFPVLTGSYAERYDLKSMSKDDVWELLNSANELNAIMTISGDTSVDSVGIIGGHAYSLIDTYTLKGNLRMLKIRNPHSTNEWTGAWSDSSDLWTQIESQTVGLEKGDDGIFFMQLEDFVKYFTSAYLGYITYSANQKKYLYYSTDASYKKAHVFTVYLPEDGQFSVTLFKPSWRFNRNLVNVAVPGTVILA
ncbi:MAG: calpain family cysteine protease, partial [archaeon]|nr:calpain family cysteine protease [archaeon]